MKKGLRRILSLLLTCALLASIAGCSSSESSTSSSDEDVYYKIGVTVYDTADPQTNMFFDYYRDYIAESFPVEFIMSDSLDSEEEEAAFIREMSEEGVGGIISFYEADIEETLKVCAEEEMYYVAGSSHFDDEVFQVIKDDPWFLGEIGPSNEMEYKCGTDMAKAFVDDGAKDFLIVSGGSCYGNNFMHTARTVGMLKELKADLGLTYPDAEENLALVTELTVVDTGRSDVNLVISPGYVQSEQGFANLEQALLDYDYDALMSVQTLSDVIDTLADDILTTDQFLRVGVVDCFSIENYDAVETTDNQGKPLLNYVKGKYSAMIAPAFIAMFNALSGDVDVVKPDGEAFSLVQDYWTAESEEEYVELYGYTQSIYVNAISSADMMQVIRMYNEDADFEGFREFTESSDMESVRARMGE